MFTVNIVKSTGRTVLRHSLDRKSGEVTVSRRLSERESWIKRKARMRAERARAEMEARLIDEILSGNPEVLFDSSKWDTSK